MARDEHAAARNEAARNEAARNEAATVAYELPPSPLAAAMGIEIVEAAPDRVVATMPIAGNTQPWGLLHGGASCVLAETVGSIAAVLHAGPGRMAVGVDINATHHRAMRDGVVTAVATPAHRGRTVATYDVVISDALGRRVATARLTCNLIARPSSNAGEGAGEGAGPAPG